MNLSDYVNVKSASMGLSRVVNFVKEDPKTGNTVTVDAWTSYKLEKGDDPLTRKETRFYRFDKTLDYNHCVDAALTRAAMDYFGWTEDRLLAEMNAVTDAYAKKAVEKPVETVEKVEEEPKKDLKIKIGDTELSPDEVENISLKKEEAKPVVKKKTRRKKKVAKKVEVVEPVAEAVDPVHVEEEDEFADLIEPVIELVPFDRDNMPHRPHMTAYIVSKLGRDWKSKPENKTLVNKFLLNMKDVPLFTPLGEPRDDFTSILDKYFV